MSFIFFIFGACVGSFLNCMTYRLYKKETIQGRSFCDNCGHTLYAKDLIPVISYVFLMGKCRYCRKKVSIEHPIIEILTGLLFFSFYFPVTSFFDAVTLLYLLVVVSLLIFIFIYDLRHYIIPNIIIYPLIIISFLYTIFQSYFLSDFSIFFYSLLSALGAFLFFFSIFFISKGKWMGFGDVRYVVFMGMFLGFPNIIAGLFLSFFIGAIIGIILLFLKRKGLKSEIPFGPFLITGTIIAHFFGSIIISTYLSYLL